MDSPMFLQCRRWAANFYTWEWGTEPPPLEPLSTFPQRLFARWFAGLKKQYVWMLAAVAIYYASSKIMQFLLKCHNVTEIPVPPILGRWFYPIQQLHDDQTEEIREKEYNIKMMANSVLWGVGMSIGQHYSTCREKATPDNTYYSGLLHILWLGRIASAFVQCLPAADGYTFVTKSELYGHAVISLTMLAYLIWFSKRSGKGFENSPLHLESFLTNTLLFGLVFGTFIWSGDSLKRFLTVVGCALVSFKLLLCWEAWRMAREGHISLPGQDNLAVLPMPDHHENARGTEAGEVEVGEKNAGMIEDGSHDDAALSPTAAISGLKSVVGEVARLKRPRRRSPMEPWDWTKVVREPGVLIAREKKSFRTRPSFRNTKCRASHLAVATWPLGAMPGCLEYYLLLPISALLTPDGPQNYSAECQRFYLQQELLLLYNRSILTQTMETTRLPRPRRPRYMVATMCHRIHSTSRTGYERDQDIQENLPRMLDPAFPAGNDYNDSQPSSPAIEVVIGALVKRKYHVRRWHT
ncbi:hypothetical protein BU16DRAFT_582296 [Lophium mytilinum]|uniref:Uncharacterized protein n=1 Tax=Lophium mytilinum TaxID=390894 RepID=A0A6A6QU17_9PEZI|nr:hypothetical protein BU16DRAFT_582296 [Lophium mytilinum]